jgi:hypothetical protein
MSRGGSAKRSRGAVGWEALAQHQQMIGGGSRQGKKTMQQSNRIFKEGGGREECQARVLMSWEWPWRQCQSVRNCKGEGVEEGWMEVMPSGARPTMMGVREANVVQACGRRNKSGRGKEGGSGQGQGLGNNGGNVVVQAADGG